MAGEQRVDAFNASKRVTYARAHRFARALRLIAESPLATAESSSRAELVDERVSLGDRAFRTARVASGVSLGDLTLELRQPSGVLGSRVLIEQDVCATRRGRAGPAA